jgi:hypothetical protein
VPDEDAHEKARDESSLLLYEEALRLRNLQDARLEDMRKRSLTLLSFVSAAVTVVVGVADEHEISTGAIWAALVMVGVMVGSAIVVQSPSDYIDGPDIKSMASEHYEHADPGHRVRRDLATYHYDHFVKNERKPISRAADALKIEIAAGGGAVIAVLIGAAI